MGEERLREALLARCRPGRLEPPGPSRIERVLGDAGGVRAAVLRQDGRTGKTIPELAQDLGVSGQTLRNWLHQVDVDAGRGGPGELSTAEREELRRLRRDNHILRQERDIRRQKKKAAAFFARETTR